jgi:hypothetical protein
VEGDGVSCGPIACLKLMEIYGFIEEGSIARIGESSHGYWPIVMDYFNNCVRRYDNILKAKMHTNQFNTNQEKAAKDDGVADLASQNAAESDVDNRVPAVVSAAELASVNCAIALSKRNKKQEASALKEMKRYGNAAIVLGAEPGAVVTLKVDYRTHSHAQGLIAIICDVKETGGILVCCDHSVITHSGTKGNYWVPVDKYVIVARKEEGCPLPAELAVVCQKVLSGEFDPKSRPRILYSKLHERSINASSPVKRSMGCRCKNGVCGKACECNKKGVHCHSGCSCNYNCCK